MTWSNLITSPFSVKQIGCDQSVIASKSLPSSSLIHMSNPVRFNAMEKEASILHFRHPSNGGCPWGNYYGSWMVVPFVTVVGANRRYYCCGWVCFVKFVWKQSSCKCFAHFNIWLHTSVTRCHTFMFWIFHKLLVIGTTSRVALASLLTKVRI